MNLKNMADAIVDEFANHPFENLSLIHAVWTSLKVLFLETLGYEIGLRVTEDAVNKWRRRKESNHD